MKKMRFCMKKNENNSSQFFLFHVMFHEDEINVVEVNSFSGKIFSFLVRQNKFLFSHSQDFISNALLNIINMHRIKENI